jgi:putative flippase GtrA
MTALNNTTTVGATGRSPLPETIIQITKFMTVGVLNTAIDAAAYFALTRWLGLGSMLVLAKGIAYVIGMVNSFFWNRSWTFGDNGNIWRAAGLFTLTHIAALAINAGTMALALDWLHLPEIIALGAATAASFIWNFVLNKLVVFR